MKEDIFFLVHKSEKSKHIRLHKENLIGSHLACDIYINIHDSQEKLCKIKLTDEGILVRSLDVDKLVKINGIPVFEAFASPHDRIQVTDNDIFEVQNLNERKVNQFVLKSKNPIWQDQLNALSNFAISEQPVLILGPSGTGKEEIARILHEKSSRKHGPLIFVNCSALSENLIESELFGHVKGSFTGAISDRKGAFQSARGGTLVLDEIGDLPLDLQPKLLRALENKEIHPVGSDKNIKTDVRIVASTHQHLTEKIKDGLFREDLYFRLNILKISPPPLKKRMEDFEDLLLYFCQKENLKLSQKILKLLKNYHWPGNIRELKNFVTRATALYQNNDIKEHDLIKLIDDIDPRLILDPHFTRFDAKNITMKEAEKKLIIKSLMYNYGNQRRASEQLGIPKSTLSDKIKFYGINIPDIKRKSKKIINHG